MPHKSRCQVLRCEQSLGRQRIGHTPREKRRCFGTRWLTRSNPSKSLLAVHRVRRTQEKMELEATLTRESMMMLVIDESWNVTPWSLSSSVSPTLLASSGVASSPTYESQIDWEMIEFLERIKTNRRLSDTFFYPLLFAYALMIGFGVLANCLIIALVVRQRSR